MNIIIIPAYEPNENLIKLVDGLKKRTNDPIIVVNDGSDINCNEIFITAGEKGCHVVNHKNNQGKGAAIKSGIVYANTTFANYTGYVTCDADGQHLPSDIIKVSKKLEENPYSLILGQRDFTHKDVPLKSKIGNSFSARYFKRNTKVTCKDTQTGLRGIPFTLTDESLKISENKYDYEMMFLMNVALAKLKFIEVPIETVYLDNNNSSHFRPIVDSMRIYKKPIRFTLSSLSSALVDLAVFTLLTYLLNEEIAIVVFIATISARLISGVYNFLLNRIWSFKSKTAIKKQFIRYVFLYIIQLSLSILLVTLLSAIPIHLTIIKIIVDSILFVGSYFIQKKWVFSPLLTKQKTLNN